MQRMDLFFFFHVPVYIRKEFSCLSLRIREFQVLAKYHGGLFFCKWILFLISVSWNILHLLVKNELSLCLGATLPFGVHCQGWMLCVI